MSAGMNPKTSCDYDDALQYGVDDLFRQNRIGSFVIPVRDTLRFTNEERTISLQFWDLEVTSCDICREPRLHVGAAVDAG